MTEFDTQEHADLANQEAQSSAPGEESFSTSESGLIPCPDSIFYPSTTSQNDGCHGVENCSGVENPEPTHIQDIQEVKAGTMSATDLKAKYPGEYSSWKNMKQRVKKAQAEGKALKYAQDFEEFPGFLAALGPKPFPSATVDRIDVAKGYYPLNCRWADKETQGNNKSNVVTVTYEGETRTLTEWANLLDIPRSVLVYRHSKGWSDLEVIEGKKDDGPMVPDFILELPWPDGKQDAWERRYMTECKARESREQFMFRFTKERLARLDAHSSRFYDLHCDPYQDPLPPPPPVKVGGKLVPWQEEWDHWEALHNHAKAQLYPKVRREAFIYREGGLGSRKERLIYDWLVSQVGEVEFDPKKFPRKEYALPTKATSYGEGNE